MKILLASIVLCFGKLLYSQENFDRVFTFSNQQYVGKVLNVNDNEITIEVHDQGNKILPRSNVKMIIYKDNTVVNFESFHYELEKAVLLSKQGKDTEAKDILVQLRNNEDDKISSSALYHIITLGYSASIENDISDFISKYSNDIRASNLKVFLNDKKKWNIIDSKAKYYITDNNLLRLTLKDFLSVAIYNSPSYYFNSNVITFQDVSEKKYYLHLIAEQSAYLLHGTRDFFNYVFRCGFHITEYPITSMNDSQIKELLSSKSTISYFKKCDPKKGPVYKGKDEYFKKTKVRTIEEKPNKSIIENKFELTVPEIWGRVYFKKSGTSILETTIFSIYIDQLKL